MQMSLNHTLGQHVHPTMGRPWIISQKWPYLLVGLVYMMIGLKPTAAVSNLSGWRYAKAMCDPSPQGGLSLSSVAGRGKNILDFKWFFKKSKEREREEFDIILCNASISFSLFYFFISHTSGMAPGAVLIQYLVKTEKSPQLLEGFASKKNWVSFIWWNI